MAGGFVAHNNSRYERVAKKMMGNLVIKSNQRAGELWEQKSLRESLSNSSSVRPINSSLVFLNIGLLCTNGQSTEDSFQITLITCSFSSF